MENIKPNYIYSPIYKSVTKFTFVLYGANLFLGNPVKKPTKK